MSPEGRAGGVLSQTAPKKDDFPRGAVALYLLKATHVFMAESSKQGNIAANDRQS